MRIGIVKELIPPSFADAEVKQAFERSIKVFEDLGCVVEEITLPLVTQAAPIFVAICDTDGAQVHYKDLRIRPQDYDSATRTRLMSASLVPAGIYSRAQQLRVLFRDQMLAALDRVDVLLSPMSNGPATKIEGEHVVFNSKEDVIRRQFGARSFTTPYSLAAMPGIALPCGFTSSGMPVAIQLGGRPFAEETLFRAAFAFESATEWHTLQPQL